MSIKPFVIILIVAICAILMCSLSSKIITVTVPSNSKFVPIACTFYTKNNAYEESFKNLKNKWELYSEIPLHAYIEEGELPAFKGYKIRHHWSGNSTKIDYIIQAMKDFADYTHILFMDCDVQLLKYGFDGVLKNYQSHELVCACERTIGKIANIGFMLIINNHKMREFFQHVSQEVREKQVHDQSVVLKLISQHNTDLKFFKESDVLVFPSFKSRIINDDPFIIKPIRGFTKSSKLKIIDTAINGSKIDKLLI